MSSQRAFLCPAEGSSRPAAGSAPSPPMSLEEQVQELCKQARRASRRMAPRSTRSKNAALEGIAAGLEARSVEILAANRSDVEAARQKGTKGALLDRLTLDEVRLEAIAESVREVAALPDPVGE